MWPCTVGHLAILFIDTALIHGPVQSITAVPVACKKSPAERAPYQFITNGTAIHSSTFRRSQNGERDERICETGQMYFHRSTPVHAFASTPVPIVLALRSNWKTDLHPRPST